MENKQSLDEMINYFEYKTIVNFVNFKSKYHNDIDNNIHVVGQILLLWRLTYRGIIQPLMTLYKS
jgi:hypothetical protein